MRVPYAAFQIPTVCRPSGHEPNINMSRETRGTAAHPRPSACHPGSATLRGCPPPGCRLELVSSSKFSVSCCLFFFFLHSRSNSQRFAIRSRRYNLLTNSCTSFKLPVNGIPKGNRHLRLDPTRSGQRPNVGVYLLLMDVPFTWIL